MRKRVLVLSVERSRLPLLFRRHGSHEPCRTVRWPGPRPCFGARAAELIDADLDLDLVLSRLNTTGFELYMNDGGVFGLASVVETDIEVTAFEVGDLDGDGDLDLVTVEREVPYLQWALSTWLVDGSGALIEGPVTPLPIPASAAHITDIDRDGIVDVFVEAAKVLVALPNADATWENLGESLAGSSGRSGLDGFGALTSGGDIALVLDRSLPLASTSLVLGFSEFAAPFAGGTFVPSPDVILSGLITDAAGELEIVATLPAGLPAGIELFFQAWQSDPVGGFSATTALLGTTR